jgi:hypothetical protein
MAVEVAGERYFTITAVNVISNDRTAVETLEDQQNSRR